MGEIALRPVEVGLGKIECRRFSPRQGCGDRERARIGEGIEQALARGHQAADFGAVVALVEENALRIARLERDFGGLAVFEDQEGLGHFRPREVRRRFFLVLVELLPITGNVLVADPFADLRGEMAVAGRNQPAASVGFKDQAGQSVAAAIDEADGVRLWAEEMRALGDRVLEKMMHEGARR